MTSYDIWSSFPDSHSDHKVSVHSLHQYGHCIATIYDTNAEVPTQKFKYISGENATVIRRLGQDICSVPKMAIAS